MTDWFQWMRRAAGGPSGEGEPSAPMPEADEATRGAALRALEGVIDPELGVDVVSLGMVRRVEREGEVVRISLALTSPACPAGSWIAEQARSAVLEALPDLRDVAVVLVSDPPWSPEDMSESARRMLGMGF